MKDTAVLYKGVVHPWHCDVMGHMNVRHYVAMFDDAGYHLLQEITGWSANAEGWKGKGWVDVSQKIEYQNELRVGDLVEIEGGATEIGKSSFTACYFMKNKVSEQRCALMTTKFVLFDRNARCALPLTNELRIKIDANLLS